LGEASRASHRILFTWKERRSDISYKLLLRVKMELLRGGEDGEVRTHGSFSTFTGPGEKRGETIAQVFMEGFHHKQGEELELRTGTSRRIRRKKKKRTWTDLKRATTLS